MLPSVAWLNAQPEGTGSSAVRVIAYEDLQCSHCAVYRKMMDDVLLPKFGDRVAFEHRDFPLPQHKWSRQAAFAGRYFETLAPSLGVAYRRHVFTKQQNITPENIVTNLREFARLHHAGFDPEILNQPKWNLAVEQDYQEGIAKGVARIPTVIINGKPFSETFTVDDISKGIDAALASVPITG